MGARASAICKDLCSTKVEKRSHSRYPWDSAFKSAGRRLTTGRKSIAGALLEFRDAYRGQPAREIVGASRAAAGQIDTMRSAISIVERRCATMILAIGRDRTATLMVRSLSSSR